MIEQCVKRGVEREELLREANLRSEEISEPDARIPVSKLADLWRAILSHFPERDLGVRLGAAFHVRQAGLMGYLFLNSPDLQTAVERTVRFSRVLNEDVRPEFRLEAGRGILSWVPSPLFRPYPQVADWILSAWLTCLRQASGADLVPGEVWFPYPSPRPAPAAHWSHFGPSLRFGGNRAGLVLTTEQLELPVIGADDELAVYLERHAEEVLAKLSSDAELVGKVRNRIWEDLRHGRPTLDGIAAGLGMSPRSLQRGLRAEHTSFADVRDEILRNVATSLLRDRSLGVHEIAALLGYSEPSTFYRAFRRWVKTSPVDYRAAS